MTDITETKIVAHINCQLKGVLNRLVKNRLDDILGTVPVDKLIGETRAAESYRYPMTTSNLFLPIFFSSVQDHNNAPPTRGLDEMIAEFLNSSTVTIEIKQFCC